MVNLKVRKLRWGGHYNCSSSFLTGRDWEDHSLNPARQKISETPPAPSQQRKLSVVVHTCHLSYMESINRKITSRPAWE
jgi:hypothetical protein